MGANPFSTVCFQNLTGRRGRIEAAARGGRFLPEEHEVAVATIQQPRRFCLTYKVFAAGRNDAREALGDAYSRLRPTDAVVMGVYPRHRPDEVGESVRAALECLGA